MKAKLQFMALLSLTCAPLFAAERPNILWLTSEDHGPHMGCYGDAYATTPNVDALARRGMIYNRCWSNAPVCAPARSTLISGLYANSSGAEHMRSMVPMPKGAPMFPVYLREAGYYCTNNVKEDYNLEKSGKVWDASTNQAHWKNRPAGAPFFAVFNSTKSHESNLHKRAAQLMHDPAKVRVPAYHPDTPEVRQDWAQYYDSVTRADADAGARLKELDEAGLSDDTIVFYFADHGSGMPRNKRWPYNSGLQAPLVVYIPDKWKTLRPPDYKPGGASSRLVSFVDFAPTILSLAGIEAPKWMQGRAFLGKYSAAPNEYLFGFRGRMDEMSDCVRSVTDGHFVYVRNFRPDKIYGQHLAYQWLTPTTRVWEKLFHEGKLNAAQSAFWKPKPPEELYDLSSDRDEVNNLANDPAQRATLEKLRAALREHQLQIRDVGLLPEGEMHRRSKGQSPYDMARDAFPMKKIYATAEAASSLKNEALPSLQKALSDDDGAVRYWAVLGIQMRGQGAVESSRAALTKLLDDISPDAQIAAAQTLVRYGNEAESKRALEVLSRRADWKSNDVFISMAALGALESLGAKAAPVAPLFKTLPAKGEAPHTRFNEYVPRLLELLQERFG
jgi:arylsulfatase A-like enzyme